MLRPHYACSLIKRIHTLRRNKWVDDDGKKRGRCGAKGSKIICARIKTRVGIIAPNCSLPRYQRKCSREFSFAAVEVQNEAIIYFFGLKGFRGAHCVRARAPLVTENNALRESDPHHARVEAHYQRKWWRRMRNSAQQHCGAGWRHAAPKTHTHFRPRIEGRKRNR